MAAPSEDRAHEDAVDSALEAVEPVVELRVSLLACWKGPWPLWTAVKALFAANPGEIAGVILEPVDAAHRPVPDGQVSHTTLLTNLANRTQPLLRYRLSDSLRFLPGGCACASNCTTASNNN